MFSILTSDDGLHHSSSLLPPTRDMWNCISTVYFGFRMSLTIQLYLEFDLRKSECDCIFHYLLSRLLKRPQNASLLPLLLSQTACFHVLQPCWKTEKELTHEGSSRNSAPQSMTTRHSLTLKGESADLFLLAMRSLFFKLKFICDPDQRTCHTWWPKSQRALGHVLTTDYQIINGTTVLQVAWENSSLYCRSIELKPLRLWWDFKTVKDKRR